MSLRRAIIALFVVPLAACQSSAPPVARGPTSAPTPQQTWVQSPISVPPQQAMPVKEGTAPLVYLVETDTIVRVVDLSDHNAELLNMPVMARQIVSVNPELGVMVGGAIMRRGALPAEHRYAIYLQSNTENFSRTGYVRPGGATVSKNGSPP